MLQRFADLLRGRGVELRTRHLRQDRLRQPERALLRQQQVQWQSAVLQDAKVPSGPDAKALGDRRSDAPWSNSDAIAPSDACEIKQALCAPPAENATLTDVANPISLIA
jgi:hypothetical protein